MKRTLTALKKISKNSATSTTGGRVLIEPQSTKSLKLTVADLVVYASAIVAVNDCEGLPAVVDLDRLLKAVGIAGKNLWIETTEEGVHVKGSRRNVRVPLDGAPGEWPDASEIDDDIIIDMTEAEHAALVGWCRDAASTDPARSNTQGVYVQPGWIAATDTHRLHAHPFAGTVVDTLVPSIAIDTVAKVKGTARIGNRHLEIGDFDLRWRDDHSVRKFPDWEQLGYDDPVAGGSLDVSVLQGFCDDLIKLTGRGAAVLIKGNELTGFDSEKESVLTETLEQHGSDKFEWYGDASYLLDALEPDGPAVFEVKGENYPLQIKFESRHFALVMGKRQ